MKKDPTKTRAIKALKKASIFARKQQAEIESLPEITGWEELKRQSNVIRLVDSSEHRYRLSFNFPSLIFRRTENWPVIEREPVIEFMCALSWKNIIAIGEVISSPHWLIEEAAQGDINTIQRVRQILAEIGYDFDYRAPGWKVDPESFTYKMRLRTA